MLRWQSTFRPGRTKGYTPKALITLIEALAPPPVVTRYPYPALAHLQILSTSVMNMLMCPICTAVLQQPIQLPCHMCVCKQCIIDWIRISAHNQCPCCYDLACLQKGAVKLPPDIVNTLLGDVMVCCTLCGQGVRAGDYGAHECGQLSKLQLQITAQVVHVLIDHSPANTICIPTGGTVCNANYTCINND